MPLHNRLRAKKIVLIARPARFARVKLLVHSSLASIRDFECSAVPGSKKCRKVRAGGEWLALTSRGLFLLEGVIRGTDQGSGFHVLDSHGLAQLLKFGELV